MLRTERQSAQMSKIVGYTHIEVYQYGAEPFEQQQFWTAGVEGVKVEVKYIPVNNSSCRRETARCPMLFRNIVMRKSHKKLRHFANVNFAFVHCLVNFLFDRFNLDWPWTDYEGHKNFIMNLYWWIRCI